MNLTSYHAKLFAHELTKRSAADSVEKLASALSDAQVALNPHQIEAALFAFRSPLSKGAILADEVGLGKTIEAGILLAQRWAERRRRLLVISPANLRKQWSQELADKFFLPTSILEARTFQEAVRSGNLNPFQQSRIIICSYQFARAKEPYLAQTEWDLIVIDEAHRLRNVYKPGNKIGKAIKGALADRNKLLLTATPLQNSLQELYGLVSIIDEFTFGDLRSFNAQFGHAKGTSAEHDRLKERLKPLCQRTLRRQVLQYVSYTKRHALVQEFVPSAEEQRLYDLVSEYLQQPTLYALPASQRQLMTLMLRKLLASSTHAISGTLAGLAAKLEAAEQASVSPIIPADFADNFELLPELEEEWNEDDHDGLNADTPKPPVVLTPEQREERRQEIAKLREFHALASSIQRNSKGERLLTALKNGFEKAHAVNLRQAGSLQQKALIFTESRRTQDYLFDLLQTTEFAGKVVLFNGSNTDTLSQRIYRDWAARYMGTERISGSLTADKRAALVDFFRDEASIMIATEAAAEGINLQFCNLVVNYDLPWNPQRIEQRIGRCHRYGQKFDVVVVNFLNKANAADIRVYQLLAEKFQLFEGVFGASDEVLGAIESGVDFEKRIVDIYQRCRTPEQISLQFDQLQQELQSEIGQAKTNAHEQLLNNFDQEVIERVRVETSTALSRFQDILWKLARFYLTPHADFDPAGHAFALTRNPFSGENIPLGRYEMQKNSDEAHTFRVGHPLAQSILAVCCSMDTPQTAIRFHLKPNQRIASLQELQGTGGWLRCALLSMESGEPQDHLIFAGIGSSGALDTNQCRRLFDLEDAIAETSAQTRMLFETAEDSAKLDGQLEAERLRIVGEVEATHARWLDTESGKLDRWAEDRKLMLEEELRELDLAIRDTRRQSQAAGLLQAKLELTQVVSTLETERNRKRRELFEAQDRVERERDDLFARMRHRLIQQSVVKPLFTLRWSLD